jgi:hypothetical protein
MPDGVDHELFDQRGGGSAGSILVHPISLEVVAAA